MKGWRVFKYMYTHHERSVHYWQATSPYYFEIYSYPVTPQQHNYLEHYAPLGCMFMLHNIIITNILTNSLRKTYKDVIMHKSGASCSFICVLWLKGCIFYMLHHPIAIGRMKYWCTCLIFLILYTVGHIVNVHLILR